MKAVIPAAGLGSRMLPVTKCVPKEMLPIGHKPMLQYLLEEAVASGVTQICLVIREGKESIRDYFSPQRHAALEHNRQLDELKALVSRCELTFIYQREPRGLGDALLQAREFVGPDSFVMTIPDQLACSSVPATLQLMQHRNSDAAVWSSLVRLPKAESRFFPGARGFEFERIGGSEVLMMGRLLTEEEMRESFANKDYEIRGFGRTIYPPEIFQYLGLDFANPRTGEVDLSLTFDRLTETIAHRGVLLSGEFFDVGTFEGYYHYLPRLWELNG